jgi:hypothetical protein
MAQKLPSTLADYPLFQAFLSFLQQKLKMFFQTTLKLDILQIYKLMKRQLASEIAQVD